MRVGRPGRAGGEQVLDDHEDEAIRVVARVRPLTEGEEGEGHSVGLSCLDDARTVQIDTLPGDDGRRVAQSYSLDASVPPDASQVCVRGRACDTYACVCAPSRSKRGGERACG